MKNFILQDSISFPDIDLKNVKAVLIDLDDTLYFYKPAHEKALHVLHKAMMPLCKMSFQKFTEQIDDVWNAFCEEVDFSILTHNRMSTFQRFAEKNKLVRPYVIGARMKRIYFNAFMNVLKSQGPALQAKQFLEECKKRKLPVCLVTDMYAETQVRKLKALGLTRYVDFIVANDEVGFDKPNSKMFLKALQKVNLSVDDVIMVGNNMERDIEGAKNLGIRAYHVIVHK